MKRRTASVLMASMLVLGVFIGTGAQPALAMPNVIRNAAERGRWDSNGHHSASNDNYCIGRGCGARERAFFVFEDLPETDFAVVSATLQLKNTDGGGTPREMSLHQVSTPIGKLDDNDQGSAEGRAIYKDLGDGTLYGTKTPGSMSEAYISTTISPRGMLAIQNHLGGKIAIGAMLDGDTVDDFLFANSDGEPATSAQLYYYYGTRTSMSLSAPNVVVRGHTAHISGRLTSDNAACMQNVGLQVKVGSSSGPGQTDVDGRFAFTEEINRKTKVSVLYPGSNSCGVSEGKQTIRVS